jgi:hypothetical protein
VVQPHSMADDLRGAAVAVVRVGRRRHSSVSFVPTTAANPGYRDNALAQGYHSYASIITLDYAGNGFAPIGKRLP